MTEHDNFVSFINQWLMSPIWLVFSALTWPFICQPASGSLIVGAILWPPLLLAAATGSFTRPIHILYTDGLIGSGFAIVSSLLTILAIMLRLLVHYSYGDGCSEDCSEPTVYAIAFCGRTTNFIAGLCSGEHVILVRRRTQLEEDRANIAALEAEVKRLKELHRAPPAYNEALQRRA